MVWLRILSITSQVVLIVYNYFGVPQPLWLVIIWSLVFLSINLVQIWLLFQERRSVQFSDQEKELYATVFPSFTPVEFLKLLRLARWAKAEAGETLTAVGQHLDDVMLIFNGGVVVKNGDQVITQLKDGAFIGEMEFLSKKAATATVVVNEPTSYLRWSQSDLRSLLTRNPSMSSAMQTVFSADIVQKLKQTSGAV
jgi:CRP-like cAMP-binding protein